MDRKNYKKAHQDEDTPEDPIEYSIITTNEDRSQR